MRFRASELSAQLNGVLVGSDVDLDGVSIDSRNIEAGGLFVPLVAERDGHDFIGSAVAGGAAGFLTSVPGGAPIGGAAAIQVSDTGDALAAIGRIARARVDGPVIAITGSVAKTSVKDLTAAACGHVRRTHASEKSFNNELGVPLTLANAPDDAEVVILEMGARGSGHIDELCRIGRPTIGVVTTVALAHSELFGSIEGVAAAKGELIEALPANGVAVLNADDPNVLAMAGRTDAEVITFGVEAGDVRAVNVQLDGLLRPSFVLQTPSGSMGVTLEVRGAHMATNAAAAVAAAIATGIDAADAVAGLRSVTLSPWRMDVSRADNGLVVINDAYNANPTSMRAALSALGEVMASERIAVVGEMAELGVEGPAEHLAIAHEATDAGVRLIAVDAEAYGERATHVADRAEALAVLTASGAVGEGVAVLVKGSRVAGLELLAADLLSSPGT